MDNLTPLQRRRNMRNIRSTGTKEEVKLSDWLKSKGLKFILNDVNIIGKPDIVFKRKKLAIFIDSEFWHGHPKFYKEPGTNIEYWRNKISRNKKRDKLVNKELKLKGWKIIRIWSKDINKNIEKLGNLIIKRLTTNK